MRRRPPWGQVSAPALEAAGGGGGAPLGPLTKLGGTRGYGYGLIGFGPISRRVASILSGQTDGLRLAAFLVRPRDLDQARRELGADVACTTLDAFMQRRPEVAVECASQATLSEIGADLMSAGIDVMPLSLGAFADPAVEQRLAAAARRGPGRLEIPAGAIGALGLVSAGRECGLHRVLCRAVYPLTRWRHMGAGPLLDASAARERRTFFSGSVREAVMLLPGHLNVTVAVALAGLGLDETQVELVSDPNLTQAEFELAVQAEAGNTAMSVGGRDAPIDADPIDYTTFSLVRLLRRRCATVAC